jgi:hypothetical protein
MPRIAHFPTIVIDHLETPSPLNPLGLKGVGKSGTLSVAAIIASAVEDAPAERGGGDADHVRGAAAAPGPGVVVVAPARRKAGFTYGNLF